MAIYHNKLELEKKRVISKLEKALDSLLDVERECCGMEKEHTHRVAVTSIRSLLCEARN